MKDAPIDKAIIIVTLRDSHRSEWDAAYSNFWSLTAERALKEEECVGWIDPKEWESMLSVPLELCNTVWEGK